MNYEKNSFKYRLLFIISCFLLIFLFIYFCSKYYFYINKFKSKIKMFICNIKYKKSRRAKRGSDETSITPSRRSGSGTTETTVVTNNIYSIFNNNKRTINTSKNNKKIDRQRNLNKYSFLNKSFVGSIESNLNGINSFNQNDDATTIIEMKQLDINNNSSDGDDFYEHRNDTYSVNDDETSSNKRLLRPSSIQTSSYTSLPLIMVTDTTSLQTNVIDLDSLDKLIENTPTSPTIKELRNQLNEKRPPPPAQQ